MNSQNKFLITCQQYIYIDQQRVFTSAQILPTVEIVSTGYSPRKVSAPRRIASLPVSTRIVFMSWNFNEIVDVKQRFQKNHKDPKNSLKQFEFINKIGIPQIGYK